MIASRRIFGGFNGSVRRLGSVGGALSVTSCFDLVFWNIVDAFVKSFLVALNVCCRLPLWVSALASYILRRKMTPQAAAPKLATPSIKKKADSASRVKSKYWNSDGNPENVHSESPWPKKRRIDKDSASNGPGQVRLQSLPAGDSTTVANKEQHKRRFEDAFDFRPKTASGIKEEPQDEPATAAARPATLTQHFVTTKSGQPATASKTTSLAPRRDDPAEASKETTVEITERSAVVTALAYVHDGAVTEAVAALVLRRARQTASPGQGNVYDAAFIRGILADLDARCVDSDRRAFVTEMLARPLQRQLETLRSSSESLLSCLASINTPQPSSPTSKTPRRAD